MRKKKIEGEEIARRITSVSIDPKLWKKVKLKALEQDMTVYELVDKALKREIAEK